VKWAVVAKSDEFENWFTSPVCIQY
jgi:hypothetical protein